MLTHFYKDLYTPMTEMMVRNQAHLNNTAYSDKWLELGQSKEWDYTIAAMQEIGEFVESYWSAWWSKAKEPDFANCRIELVDALHFILSEALIGTHGDVDLVVDEMRYSLELMGNPELVDEVANPLEFVKNLQAGLATNNIPFYHLFTLCASIDFSYEQLFALYMGKSELNKFRQKHGYREGKYQKKWDGVKEDNYFMSEWIAQQGVPPTPDQIQQWMETTYAEYVRSEG